MTKYSIKNICLGIGIGLIIASIANISTAPKGLSKEKIRNEANKYGLIVMDAKDMIQKQPQKEPQQQAPVQQEKPKQAEAAVVVIEPGNSSENIAEMLMDNKLIDSKQAFLSRLKELNKESKVQIGTFKIPAGTSIDNIVQIITSAPTVQVQP